MSITNDTGATIAGAERVDLFATAAGVNGLRVGSAVRRVRLGAGRWARVAVPVRSLQLPAGSYTIVPQATAPDGSVETGVAGPVVTVADATVSLTSVVTAGRPTTPTAAGRPVVLTLALTNGGTVDAVGRATVSVVLRADGAVPDVALRPVVRFVRVRADGRPTPVRLAVRLPPTLPPGTYQPDVTVVVGTRMATPVVDPAAAATAVTVR